MFIYIIKQSKIKNKIKFKKLKKLNNDNII